MLELGIYALEGPLLGLQLGTLFSNFECASCRFLSTCPGWIIGCVISISLLTNKYLVV